MRPDPFSALDQVEPPDQWDDIVDRAAHDTDVRLLDEAPRRSALTRPRTWIAAAAAVALVGGGIVLAGGGDDPEGVEIDPAQSTSPATDAAGRCAYTVEIGPDIPELEPGRQVFEPEMGILAGPTTPTFARGAIDGLAVEVGVGTGMTTAALPEPGSYRTGSEGAGGFVEVAGVEESGVAAPCDQVVVIVRKALTMDQWTEIEDGGPVPPQLSDTLDTVLAAVSVRDLAAEDAVRTDEPVTIDGRCPFTVDEGAPVHLVPGRHPVEPELGILPGPVEPTFAHGDVDDLLVEVAVGTGIDTAVAADGQSLRSSVEGGTGWVEVVYFDTTRPDGVCNETAVVVRVPMRPADVATGGADLDVETYSELSQVGMFILSSITGGDGDDDHASSTTFPHIEGTLDEGGPFEVWEDPGHGLCASLGDVDLGCDDVGPVIAPDADPSTPRLGIDECCTPLWFGYLPDDAVDVVLTDAAGERLDVESVLGDGIWAVPVPGEHAEDSFDGTDTRVVYLQSDGTEEPAPHVG